MSTSAPRRATAVQLAFMVYMVVCGGAYGLEEIVSSTGPGLAMLVLFVLPIVYAAPMALTCAELMARFPVEGGYYHWVRLAFGDFAGATAGWLMWLTMFATSASFAVLFGSYLRHFVPDLSQPAQFLVAAALSWVVVLINYRGIRVVGTTSVLFTLLIFVPFGVMTLLGASHWQYNPVQPFSRPDQPFTVALLNGVPIAIWLYGGFEKLTVSAEEVEDPVRTFPIAFAIGVPLCALSYIVPTMAALAALGDWQAWGEGHYVSAASQIGGRWLGMTMAAGGMVSNAGILMVTLLGQSRLPMVLAEDGLFPRAFARRHARFGTPVVSLLVTGAVLTALCTFRFAQLAGAYALAQSLMCLLIYAALFKLRGLPASRDLRRFRIPLGRPGLLLMVAPSVLLGALVMGHALFPDGSLDARQALVVLAIFGSGPLVYALARGRS
jgi:amino acid transporter